MQVRNELTATVSDEDGLDDVERVRFDVPGLEPVDGEDPQGDGTWVATIDMGQLPLGSSSITVTAYDGEDLSENRPFDFGSVEDINWLQEEGENASINLAEFDRAAEEYHIEGEFLKFRIGKPTPTGWWLIGGRWTGVSTGFKAEFDVKLDPDEHSVNIPVTTHYYARAEVLGFEIYSYEFPTDIHVNLGGGDAYVKANVGVNATSLEPDSIQLHAHVGTSFEFADINFPPIPIPLDAIPVVGNILARFIQPQIAVRITDIAVGGSIDVAYDIRPGEPDSYEGTLRLDFSGMPNIGLEVVADMLFKGGVYIGGRITQGVEVSFARAQAARLSFPGEFEATLWAEGSAFGGRPKKFPDPPHVIWSGSWDLAGGGGAALSAPRLKGNKDSPEGPSERIFPQQSVATTDIGGVNTHLLVYQQPDADGDEELYYQVKPQGGSWAPPVAVTNDDFMETAPALAVDTSGRVHLAYMRSTLPIDEWQAADDQTRLGSFEILVQRWDGTNWSIPQTVVAAAGFHGNPSIGFSRTTGTGLLVWERHTTADLEDYDGLDLEFSSFDGNQWATPARIENRSGPDWQPQVTVLPNGEATAIWLADTDGQPGAGVRAARWNGTSWEPAGMILPDGTAHPWHVTLTSLSDGRVLAAYNGIGEDGYDLILTESSDGGANWSTPIELLTDQLLVDGPRLSASADDQVALVYNGYSQGHNLMLLVRDYGSGQADWLGPTQITDGQQYEVDAQVVSGDLAVVYSVVDPFATGDNTPPPFGVDPGLSGAVQGTTVQLLPDLAIFAHTVRLSSVPQVGNEVTMTIPVKNLGLAVSEPTMLWVYDGLPSAGGQVVGTAPVESLASQQETTKQLYWTPQRELSGLLYVVVDEHNEIRSDNNSAVLNLDTEQNSPPLVVSIANDEDDGDYNLDDLSLREALKVATSLPGDNVIQFAPDLLPCTIVLDPMLGQLSINSNVVIEGPGVDHLTIDAHDSSRVLAIPVDVTVALTGLTVTGGQITAGPTPGIENGGGVFNAGTLTIDNCKLSDNTASGRYVEWPEFYEGGHGGGIYNSGSMTISDSTITGNRAYGYEMADGGDGGGIYNTGILRIDNSTVSMNHADDDSWDAGGGIYNSGVLTIDNSTISMNTSSGFFEGGHGGGVYSELGDSQEILSRVVYGRLKRAAYFG